MLTPFRLGLGGKFGDGRHWMSWAHIDDLVRLLIFAGGNSSVQGPLNCASPSPVTHAEFTRVLAATLHRPAICPIPKFPLKLAAGELAECFRQLTGNADQTEQAGFRFEYPAGA